MAVKKTSKKKSQRVMAGIAAVIFSICIVGYFGIKNAGKNAEDDIPLREYTVKRGDITAGVMGSGVISFDSVTQNSAEPVRLKEYYVDKGTMVKKGDKLAAIDADWIENQTEEARIELRRTKNVLKQAQNAKNTGILNQRKDNIEAELELENLQNESKQTQQIADSLKQQLDHINALIEETNVQLKKLPESGISAGEAGKETRQITGNRQTASDGFTERTGFRNRTDSIGCGWGAEKTGPDEGACTGPELVR